MKAKWDKNVSPVGWYIATELLRFVPDGVDPSDSKRRFLVWENLILIRAVEPENAYEKAVENGRLSNGSRAIINGMSGKWRFEGLLSLLPVHDELEDGAELMWTEYYRSSKAINKVVRSKEELEIFQVDTPSE
jgi:hypothetical protein